MLTRLNSVRFRWLAGAALAMLSVGLSVVMPSRATEKSSPPPENNQPVSFNEHIRPLFAEHCVACHGGVKQAGGLSFTFETKAFAEADSGYRAIVPGNAAESELIARIIESDPDVRMPPAEHGEALTAEEIDLFRRWIDQGAKWQEHWSLVAPQRQSPPKVQQKEWPRMPADWFVLARLEAEGLSPSAEASRREWLRRVSFDLVGLPPTEANAEAFVADTSSDAYEKVVDRLLASPHFGERWASVWLDLSRYADTVGFERDPPRAIWPYRDWLIRALNSDLPYDQFVVKQLAGDLLPEATLDDRLASAMHRNTQTNSEGGTDDEEFRVAAVIDRVNTTWQAFAGLTFGCTQCHSHPYDPIAHEEYYQFLAIFNNSGDSDVNEDFPRLAIPNDPNDYDRATKLDRQTSQLRRQVHRPVAQLADEPSSWAPLVFDQVSSTGSAEMSTRVDPESGLPEVWAQGTITAGSQFTHVGRPASSEPVTAIRIDVLPVDVEAARRTPELGFVVSRIHLYVDRPGEEQPREIAIADVFSDEPEPILEPADSLKDNTYGWGQLSRLYEARWAVFLLREPLKLGEGEKLRVVIKQNRSTDGSGALVIDRGRYATSSDPRWTQLVGDASWSSSRYKIADLRDERGKIPATSIPVMHERDPRYGRDTFVFVRGNWLDKGDEVVPGVPGVFPDPNSAGPVDRLAMARWFIAPEHPLTARVMVNRTWQQLFGTGIVETLGDFGTSGQLPSHPELLDDFAVRFRSDMKWSFKTLLREMVLSSTYRQQSFATPELVEKDPRNRLLSRGPRVRLSAEMIRDQALVLSGKFADKMYGPPVMPPQPEGIWRSVYNGHRWENATGDDRYRRAVYTYCKRTSGYPSMIAFDTPTREVCSVRRLNTNTPLQALVTLNDPVFVECAQGFAERIAAHEATSARDKIGWAYTLATGEAPKPEVLDTLLTLYEKSVENFDSTNEKHTNIAATGELYALTMIANSVMNLDDVLTK